MGPLPLEDVVASPDTDSADTLAMALEDVMELSGEEEGASVVAEKDDVAGIGQWWWRRLRWW